MKLQGSKAQKRRKGIKPLFWSFIHTRGRPQKLNLKNCKLGALGWKVRVGRFTWNLEIVNRKERKLSSGKRNLLYAFFQAAVLSGSVTLVGATLAVTTIRNSDFRSHIKFVALFFAGLYALTIAFLSDHYAKGSGYFRYKSATPYVVLVIFVFIHFASLVAYFKLPPPYNTQAEWLLIMSVVIATVILGTWQL